MISLQNFQTDFKKSFSHLAVNNPLLLAVSGGVDSVVMCDLFYKSGFDFVIAHCNFQLRDEESERDEMFVISLGEKYNKQVVVEKFETDLHAAANKISVQEAARNLRYAWFYKLMESGVAYPLCTAHHADDNIETVMMNFFRGTGLKGLTGISNYPLIIRPLISFRKSEIKQYAADNGLQYVEDSSNASNKYTRNFFRNELLPAIQKVYPQAEENILQTIEHLKNVEQVYGQAINNFKKIIIEVKENEDHLPILKLKKQPAFKTILWEIIKEKHFTPGQLGEVIKLMDADNGSYVQSEFYRIIKNRKWLIISPKNTAEFNEHIIIDENDRAVNYNQSQLRLEYIKAEHFTIPASGNIACVDAGKIKFPLMLRRWKHGDYFYPLGMKKKKKLSRFFIDQKLSLTDKENVWVLEMNKKIFWVVGYRIDDRFKIETSTKEVLKIYVE